ncbi:glycosyl hydrolase family 18 protein [Alkalihalobacterium bogoriense]|uniref:glycosyl hydrolase family 18 protein n=1 Tax=Alkalihalobacterium bogoriense TaxID=246272 RepID=UPI000479D98B|nr:glycosyl hydrolase family 18 protein [Alkalihalobacterium bogoriense]
MSNQTKKTSRTRKITWIFRGLIILLIPVVAVVYFLLPSSEQVFLTQTENRLIYKGEIYENMILMKENTPYISVEFIKAEIDSALLFDEKSESIIITTRENVVQIPEEELEIFINEEPFTFEVPTVVSENGKSYINLEPLQSVYPFSVIVEQPETVFLFADGDMVTSGQIKDGLSISESRLRTGLSLRTPFTAEVKAGETVFLEHEEDKYAFVRKMNGDGGFILNKHIESLEEKEIVVEIEPREQQEKPLIEKPINLTWEAIYTKTPTPDQLPDLQGVNVVSPTWFKLKNEKGDVSNLGTLEYTKWAKNNDKQVWALFSNDFDPDLTHEALKDFETRQTIIRQLLQYSQMYELDGINFDFENVYLQDGELVTQFMREITPYLHQLGLIVSMDITFISTSEMWSMFYNREALSEIVDYMIVMAYDEHWASSPVAGSVASIPWVDRNTNRILEEIPNEKLILGIPFYARLWQEEETDGGNIEVSSRALSMDQTAAWLKEHNISYNYDESSKQNYAEYYDKEEGITYKLWLEDFHSIEERVNIMEQYDLPGVASWARNFANDAAWEHLASLLSNEKETEK